MAGVLGRAAGHGVLGDTIQVIPSPQGALPGAPRLVKEQLLTEHWSCPEPGLARMVCHAPQSCLRLWSRVTDVMGRWDLASCAGGWPCGEIVEVERRRMRTWVGRDSLLAVAEASAPCLHCSSLAKGVLSEFSRARRNANASHASWEPGGAGRSPAGKRPSQAWRGGVPAGEPGVVAAAGV